MHLRRDFQAQAVQADEAGGVVLVVGLGRVGFHRGDVRVVEAHGGLAARDHEVALVKFHAHRAGDVLLRFFDAGLEREAFGRKPETVIDEFGILRDERVALVHVVAVRKDSRSIVSDSIWRCAKCRIAPPGVTYTPRDFMPG